MNPEKIPSRKRVELACRKIRAQFANTPESRLFYAMVADAIQTAALNRQRSEVIEARRYLRNDLIHAEIAGVDPEWVRLVLRRWLIPLH